METPQYTYYAFISYKREDEKWAKWLQDKLEHYKFPTNLNGRTDLPKSIRPTFRDVTDLSPEPLEQAINNALCNSEWLIVVCSPRSAKSPWVCKEAQTFIDLGREDHIIPFVIEGNPFSNDTATECYPEALLNLTGSKELLAANINEMGRDAAAIKVVSRMFNLRFDALWQRHEREARNHRNWIIALVAAIVFVVLVIAGYILFLNKQLKTERNEAITARKLAEQERDRAEEEKARANQEQIRAEIAEDSIRTQYNVIRKTNTDLTQAYADLNIANNDLIRSNRELTLSQIKIYCKSAIKHIEQKDFFTAQSIIINAQKLYENLKNPDYIPELEQALRAFNSSMNVTVSFLQSINKGKFQHAYLGDYDNYYIREDGKIHKYDLKGGDTKEIVFPVSDIDKGRYLSDCEHDNVVYSCSDSLIRCHNLISHNDVLLTKRDSVEEFNFVVIDQNRILGYDKKDSLFKVFNIKDSVVNVNTLHLTIPYYNRTSISVHGDSLFYRLRNELVIWSISKDKLKHRFSLLTENNSSYNNIDIEYNPLTSEFYIFPTRNPEGKIYVLPSVYNPQKRSYLIGTNKSDSFDEENLTYESSLDICSFDYNLNIFHNDTLISHSNDTITDFNRNFSTSNFLRKYQMNKPHIIVTNKSINRFYLSYEGNYFCTKADDSTWDFWTTKKMEKICSERFPDAYYLDFMNHDHNFVLYYQGKLVFYSLTEKDIIPKYSLLSPDGNYTIKEDYNYNSHKWTYSYTLTNVHTNEPIASLELKNRCKIWDISCNNRYILYTQEVCDTIIVDGIMQHTNCDSISVCHYDTHNGQKTTFRLKAYGYGDSGIEAKLSKDGLSLLVKTLTEDEEYDSYILYNTFTKQARTYRIYKRFNDNIWNKTVLHPCGNEFVTHLYAPAVGIDDVEIYNINQKYLVDLTISSESPTATSYNSTGDKIIIGYENGNVRIWGNLSKEPTNYLLAENSGSIRCVDFDETETYALAVINGERNTNSVLDSKYYLKIWHVPTKTIVETIPLTDYVKEAHFLTGSNSGILINKSFVVPFPTLDILYNNIKSRTMTQE